MKLATLDDGSRDGELVVVDRQLSKLARAAHLAPTLQAALDHWDQVEPALRALSQALATGRQPGEPFDATRMKAPLPRAYEWIDGSAYLNHIVLVRKARKAELPSTLETEPLVYQGGGGELLGPTDDIRLGDEAWGCDFESEVAVVLGDTPMGAERPEASIRLVMLANDVSLRNLIPAELAKGFGFFQSKPATAFSPVACTLDELGDTWRGGRVHLPLKTRLNGVLVGEPDAGPEMHFSFFDLIRHITKTRGFTAGTILGSGTVSNADRKKGVSCLAEKRTLEVLDTGQATTPFLKDADTVSIEMTLPDGTSLFGRIEQRVRVKGRDSSGALGGVHQSP
jgi:fumarylacetoacetate (FAA) hydrolase